MCSAPDSVSGSTDASHGLPSCRMTWLIEPFELAFQQRALVGGSLAAIALALIGTWVVIRGMTFLGDALVHGVVPGIALAIPEDWSFSVVMKDLSSMLEPELAGDGTLWRVLDSWGPDGPFPGEGGFSVWSLRASGASVEMRRVGHGFPSASGSQYSLAGSARPQ